MNRRGSTTATRRSGDTCDPAHRSRTSRSSRGVPRRRHRDGTAPARSHRATSDPGGPVTGTLEFEARPQRRESECVQVAKSFSVLRWCLDLYVVTEVGQPAEQRTPDRWRVPVRRVDGHAGVPVADRHRLIVALRRSGRAADFGAPNHHSLPRLRFGTVIAPTTRPAHPAINRLCCIPAGTGPPECSANVKWGVGSGECGWGQSSLRATAFGVTFIFGSYSASSTMRPSARKASRSCDRQASHGP